MGLMCGYKGKELNSKIGFNGLKRKFTILIILILAVLLDRLIGQEWIFRTLVIYFYVAMEGISILENAVKLDVPIPGNLKEALIQLREKGQKKGMIFFLWLRLNIGTGQHEKFWQRYKS